MRPDRTFRRNFFVIATLHVMIVVGLYLFASWHHSPAKPVFWMDGSGGGGEPGTNDPPAASPETSANPEPPPAPIEARPELLPPPPPPDPTPPSELVTPKAT